MHILAPKQPAAWLGHRCRWWALLVLVAVTLLRVTTLRRSEEGWSSPLLMWTAAPTTNTNANGATFTRTNRTSLETTPKSEINIGYRADRSIVFVHVGKAGGLSIRKATSLACWLTPGKYNTPAKMQACIQKYFAKTSVLSLQTTGYMHMHAIHNNFTSASSSTRQCFLFVLRHPVDRIISAYKYSHPSNCNDENRRNPTRPWGCQVQELLFPDNKKPLPYSKTVIAQERFASQELYQRCFPSAAMEDFAQAVMMNPPNNNTTTIHNQQQQQQQQHNIDPSCRQVARKYVQGKGNMYPAPHMNYNYAYYLSKARTLANQQGQQSKPHNSTTNTKVKKTSVSSFPANTEVFGVRTEHLWDDLSDLDIAIGGTGHFGNKKAVRHGSDEYVESPVSVEAYHKLCCVLQQELQVYLSLLMDLVVNLNQTTKEASRRELLDKCGIPQHGWNEWRASCQAQLRQEELRTT